MKNCINCGHSLELNAKFCPECGSKQPEQTQNDKKSDYSASIGDKNVISGNIIGKSEEFNISGPATINKIEDETKKFITCAVSGKHLLRGRDIVVNCPNCKSDLAQDCFNMSTGRCFNCDKQAYAKYSDKLDILLADGIIDSMERIRLDSFALSLMIDSSTKHRLETEAKERKANANLNTICGNSNELSGFYKIQFKKALALVFDNNDLAGAITVLSSIHRENIYHDETACIYFLVKAIYKSQDYINDYENEGLRTIDIYWEDFWAFIPYLKTRKFDNGFKIISLNKSRFSDNKNDILLSEVLAYLLLYSDSKEEDYYTEAKSLYSAFDRNIKKPLFQLHEFIGRLLNSNESEWEILSREFNSSDRFYYQYVLGAKLAAVDLNVVSDEVLINENKIQKDGSLDEFSMIYPFRTELKWTFSAMDNITVVPLIHNEYILFSSWDCYFYCLDKNNGSIKWKFKTRNAVIGQPIMIEDSVFFGDNAGYFYCLKIDTGNLNWSYCIDAEGQIRTKPLVKDTQVFVCSNGGSLFWFDFKTGSVLKSIVIDGYFYNDPLFDGNNILLVSGSKVYIIDFINGKINNTYTLGSKINYGLVGNGQIVYVAEKNKNLHSLDLLTNNALWNLKFKGDPEQGGIILHQGVLYFSCPDGYIYKMDLSTGNVFWKQNLRSELVGNPQIIGSFLFVGARNGFIYCLDSIKGLILWEFKTNDYMLAQVAMENKFLFVAAPDGDLRCFNLID
jgi:outer membrane protein assembly factor BamB